MSFAALAQRRRLAGYAGCLLLLLVLACLVDGMIAGGLADPKAFDLLPGQSLSLSEVMPRGAARLEDLRWQASDARIALRPQETFSGFWLGGTLWRAQATPPADLPPGEYGVSVLYQNGTVPDPKQNFRLNVRANAQAIQAAAGSRITRLTGISPYRLAAILLPLSLLPMLVSYVLSRKIAQALRAGGMCEIFRSMAGPEGQRIFFSPGPGHGLEAGSPVEVLDERGQGLLGRALVLETAGENVTALMQDGVNVRPGTLARLPKSS